MTKFGADLIQSMSEVLAHAQDEDLPGITIEVGEMQAKAIRKKLDLKQDEMATLSRPTWLPGAEGGVGAFLQSGRFGEVGAEPISPALVFAGHLGRGVAELLLDVAFFDFCRGGKA